MGGERFYAVRLLWVHDPDTFAEYQEMAKPTPGQVQVRLSEE